MPRAQCRKLIAGLSDGSDTSAMPLCHLASLRFGSLMKSCADAVPPCAKLPIRFDGTAYTKIYLAGLSHAYKRQHVKRQQAVANSRP
jgi:hypothetical protein